MKDWSRSFSRRLAILRDLHRQGRMALALRSVGFAVAVPALLRLPLPKLDALIEWMVEGAAGPAEASDPADAAAAASTVLHILDVARPLLRRGCLTRGLTLYYGLRRAGVPAALCFGMGRVSGGDGFDGHCWVELNGAPFLESRDPRGHFAGMYVFGAGATQGGERP